MAAYGPNGRYDGVRALWIKVIIRAVFDWVTYKSSTKLAQRRLAESAFIWLFRPSLFFNGFESICSCLDVSPAVIRAWAGRITRRQVAKIELLERGRSDDPKARKKLLCAYRER